MIWSIGYRGLNDYPFWQDDPEINTDQKRAAVINEAMANQTALVRSLLPNQEVPHDNVSVTYNLLGLVYYLLVDGNVSVLFCGTH